METPKATPTPAAPAAQTTTSNAPKTSEDYIQAAIEGVKKLPPEPEAPVEPKVEEKPEAETEEAAPELKEGEEKPAGKKPEEVKPPEEVPDTIKQSFAVLAREKAALRAEREAMAADKAAVEQAKALLNAKSPLELLRLKGFTYKMAADEIVAGKFDPPAEKKPAETSEAMQEVQKLRAELQTERRAAARANVNAQIKTAARAAGEQFKFVTGMGAEDQAQHFLEQYWSDAGELPVPGNMPESIKVALAAVEKHLRSQGEKWKGLLGNAGDSKKVPEAPKSEVPQAESDRAEQQHSTLTNSQSAAPRGTAPQSKVPRTAEEYQAAALAAVKALENQ